MKTQVKYISLFTILAVAILVTSCGRDRNSPGIEFAPEMYESIPYEPFTQVTDSTAPFKNGRNQQLPPEGTISRWGEAAFAFPNSEDDSIRHSAGVKGMVNPIPRTEKTMKEGEVLYQRYCGTCHGVKGAGDGKVSEHDAINPNAYNAGSIADFTPGEIYYVIMHGKGVMGSYASQMSTEERWKSVHFIEQLQGRSMAFEAETFDAANADVDGIDVGNIYKLKNILYEIGMNDLKQESKSELDYLYSFMDKNKKVRVQFQGHTDSDGDTTANRQLSEARANSVVTYLVEKGISESRLSAIGMGSGFPVAVNSSAGNKAKNRRTEIKFLSK